MASEKSDCVNRVSIPSTQDKIGSDQTVSEFCAETSVKQSGVGHCIVMWWTLDMDSDGEIKLTTAPRWAHPEGINRQVQMFLLVTRGTFECFCWDSKLSLSSFYSGTALYLSPCWRK